MQIKVLRSILLPILSSQRFDLIFAGKRILGITEPGRLSASTLSVTEIDGQSYAGMPGLIDPHVHVLGGGGASGYKSYVEGPRAQDLWQKGITSVIGCLGFDSATRSLTALIRKTKSLQASGLGAFCLIGGFNFPPLTVTGDIRTDFVIISEVVGAGELAVDDFRGSFISDRALADYAVMSVTGGMLSGKSGIINIHLGEDPGTFMRLRKICKDARLPLKTFHVTHVNRHLKTLEAAAEFAKSGGLIDVSTDLPPTKNGPVPPVESIIKLLQWEVPEERITVSTDGFGGMSMKTDGGEVFVPSPVDGLLDTVLELINQGLPPVKVWNLVSKNAADIYGLEGRGVLEPGAFADILLFDAKIKNLKAVILAGTLSKIESEAF